MYFVKFENSEKIKEKVCEDLILVGQWIRGDSSLHRKEIHVVTILLTVDWDTFIRNARSSSESPRLRRTKVIKNSSSTEVFFL